VGVVNYWFFKHANENDMGKPVYYFRLLEPDFTEMPAWGTLADYASSERAQTTEPQPAWKFSWQQGRPFLILFGGSLLFLWLLWFLSKGTILQESQ
jgi:hypothetical protein